MPDKREKIRPCNKDTFHIYLIKVARLGGYLAPRRQVDPPPGNTVMWQRPSPSLADITIERHPPRTT